MTVWNNKSKGQAFTPNGAMVSTNTWATLPRGKDLKLAHANHMTPSLGKVELDRMVALWRWWTASNGGIEVESATGGAHDRRVSGGSEGHGGRNGSLTLSEAREGMFFDATFKVSASFIVSNSTLTPRLDHAHHNQCSTKSGSRALHIRRYNLPLPHAKLPQYRRIPPFQCGLLARYQGPPYDGRTTYPRCW